MTPERIAGLKQAFADARWRSEQGRHPEGFPALPEVPVGRYIDPAFYAAEQEHLWPKAWLIAGHVDELPEAGSYKLWERAGWPVLLVRGDDGEIRAFFNSCRHRGGGVVREASGKTRKLKCRFHGWVYDLDGRLRHVPEMQDFPGLDLDSKSLLPIRCEIWGNLIFINRDANAKPLVDALGRVTQELAHFEFDKRRVAAIIPYELPCNWKVIVDAFQESYHLDATHTNTVAPLLDMRGSVVEMWPNGHSVLLVPRRPETVGQDFILDAGSKSHDPRHELTRDSNISFTIYPNIIGTAAEYQFPILSFWPTGLNTTHVDIMITEPRDGAGFSPETAQAIIEQFGQVMLEDMGNVASLQKSIESGALDTIRLGYQERRIYQFHEQLDADLGDAVPEALRVPRLLHRWIETGA